jgi:hypothetical protein
MNMKSFGFHCFRDFGDAAPTENGLGDEQLLPGERSEPFNATLPFLPITI